jgi:type I restriction enzyme, R subunit
VCWRDGYDLSTYGLERSRLEVKIGLDDSETELEPGQNPNLRGVHSGPEVKDLLYEIVKAFNERHFAGCGGGHTRRAAGQVHQHRQARDEVRRLHDYKAQVEDNPDSQNRQLALERLIQHAVSIERRRELDLYKRYAGDPDFKWAFDASVSRLLASAGNAAFLAGG